MTGLILEPFGGPGGWSTGLALLGRTDGIGVELDADACRTAVAAGHRRVRADVAAFPLDHLAGQVEGVVMSPPCQAFSRAGKRLGLLDQPALYAHLRLVQRAGRWVDYDPDGWHDPRSPLVLQVVRWADALRPAWVACEQVPDVAPLWRAVARWMRGLGYASAVGMRSSEQFGVPQTRQRAFLVAARDGRPVRLPPATHRAYRSAAPEGPDLFGDGPLPWVSMADALGWGDGVSVDCASPFQVVPGFDAVARPSRTLTHKSRSWTLETEQRSDRWEIHGTAQDNATQIPDDTGDYQRRDSGEPSPTVSGQGRSWAIEDEDDQAVRVEVWQAGVLQSFPADYPWRGTRTAQYRQVGDAVPPLLAAAVLGELLGVDWRHRLWGLEAAS